MIGAFSFLASHKTIVGVSLLAIAVWQSALPSLMHRYREQAHSYISILGVIATTVPAANH